MVGGVAAAAGVVARVGGVVAGWGRAEAEAEPPVAAGCWDGGGL